MAKQIRVIAPAGPLKASVRLPGSKSISNRLLIMRALSREHPVIQNLSPADDTQLLTKLLAQEESEFYVDNAGTVARFLLAFLSVSDRKTAIRGSERMHQRPMAGLINALRSLGAKIKCLEQEGFLPVEIEGKKLKGGKVNLDPSQSSQFVSAMMLIAPTLSHGLEIKLVGSLISEPYVLMTAKLMRRSGVDVRFKEQLITIPKGGYLLGKSVVEPDWSSAAFWYEMAALRKGSEINLPGLSTNSVQGDAWCEELFYSLGVNSEEGSEGITLISEETLLEKIVRPRDFSSNPDLALPYASAVAGLGLKGSLSGLGTLRYKESDRLKAMVSELEKCGVEISQPGENLNIASRNELKKVPVLHGYSDHRVVMSLVPLALQMGEITITDRDSVTKSYPGYWKDLTACGFNIEEL